jgi:hypothetical protein
MAARANVWPATREAVLELIGPALRASRSVMEAAEKLGKSDGSLRGVCRAHRVEYRSLLMAPASAGVAVPGGDCPKNAEPFGQPEPPPLIDWTGARPVSSGVGLERRVVLGDLHIPFHDLGACAAALAVIRALQPHRILQLGDYFNMGAVSHHPRPFGGPENHDRSLRMGMAFAEALRKAAPGAEIAILAGNHDLWAEEYEDANPQFKGLMAARHLGLDRIGVRWVPRAEQPLVVGPVAYLHGYGGGEHYAKKYAIDVAPAVGVKHLKVAHHHSVQRFHAKNGCECWGVGWLGRPECSAFDYAKNRDHWEAALLVEDIVGDRVTTTPVLLSSEGALFGGRMIGRAA